MRFGIAGAGAVGCHYGSLLQQAGYDVVLFTRGQHLRQLQIHGLHHVTSDKEVLLNVSASDDPSILQAVDVVLLTCKMTALEPMLKQVASHVSQDSLLISMQNGVVAPQLVSTQFPNHQIMAASAFIGVRMPQAGYVIHSASGHIMLGAWQHISAETVKDVQAAFESASIPCVLKQNMHKVLWHKMLWNCGFNAFSALTRRYAKDLAVEAPYATLVRKAMLETLAVAQAHGIDLNEDHIEQHIEQTASAGIIQSSMWQDIEAGKMTEIDFLNGFIVCEAKRLGLNADVNDYFTILIDALQSHGLLLE